MDLKKNYGNLVSSGAYEIYMEVKCKMMKIRDELIKTFSLFLDRY